MKSNELNVNIECICLDLLDSVLSPKSAAYVAGPLDSGLLFYEFLAKSKFDLNIRELNQKRLTSFACRLRESLPYPVIDPGPLRIPNWTGHDYGLFFLKVISRYVKEVWFIQGWEYSRGATKEFKYCISTDIICLDESGNMLSLGIGKELIEQAVSHINTMGIDGSNVSIHLI